MIKDSKLVGKTIKATDNRVGLVVQGYEVENEDSPYKEVFLVMYSDGEKEVLLKHVDDRYNEYKVLDSK
tara:strand:+ start:284 stop:490 length:207 start_codon:yes stop_codon:yes gene_type:complete